MGGGSEPGQRGGPGAAEGGEGTEASQAPSLSGQLRCGQ
jgi:hypothetical protein